MARDDLRFPRGGRSIAPDAAGSEGAPALGCCACGGEFRADEVETRAVACNVRAFRAETFHAWRCPACRCIHCRERVDLARYYAGYPVFSLRLNRVRRMLYRPLLRRLRRDGFGPGCTLLDYGCGGGAFVHYLREKGYFGAEGYDPYAPAEGFGDPRALDKGPFEYVLLQDVVEHVQDPAALLSEVNRYAAAGGYVLVGTPDAGRIDLARPERHVNELHLPYHRHILTREALESMGQRVGWRPVRFYERAYHDCPWLGLNSRAVKVYQSLMDGTVDSLGEPIRAGRALRSGRFLFAAFVGYFFRYKGEMAVMFRRARSWAR